MYICTYLYSVCVCVCMCMCLCVCVCVCVCVCGRRAGRHYDSTRNDQVGGHNHQHPTTQAPTQAPSPAHTHKKGHTDRDTHAQAHSPGPGSFESLRHMTSATCKTLKVRRHSMQSPGAKLLAARPLAHDHVEERRRLAKEARCQRPNTRPVCHAHTTQTT